MKGTMDKEWHLLTGLGNYQTPGSQWATNAMLWPLCPSMCLFCEMLNLYLTVPLHIIHYHTWIGVLQGSAWAHLQSKEKPGNIPFTVICTPRGNFGSLIDLNMTVGGHPEKRTYRYRVLFEIPPRYLKTSSQSFIFCNIFYRFCLLLISYYSHWWYSHILFCIICRLVLILVIIRQGWLWRGYFASFYDDLWYP